MPEEKNIKGGRSVWKDNGEIGAGTGRRMWGKSGGKERRKGSASEIC